MHEELINFLNEIGCRGPKEDCNGNISILDVKESDYEKVINIVKKTAIFFACLEKTPFGKTPTGIGTLMAQFKQDTG